MSDARASARLYDPSLGMPGFDDDFAALNDAAVRDLAWLLLSADLLRAQPPPLPHALFAQLFSGADEKRAALNWLAALDRDPAPLHAALARASATRLGRYAEALLGWFFAHGPSARLVAQNVAVRGEGRTLGECDFLLETRAGERLHWELAVKCYLHAGGAALADFVGPNLRDRFDWKLAHLRDRQLRLSERAEFAALGYAGPWRAQMLVKGRLFYRATGAPLPPLPDAPELAAAHARGWWVTQSEWPAFARAQRAEGWSALPRLAWLAPRRITANVDAADMGAIPIDATNSPEMAMPPDSDPAEKARSWTARSAVAAPADPETLLAALVAQSNREEPSMVAAFALDASNGYVEQSRGFIVPDNWPERAASFART